MPPDYKHQLRHGGRGQKRMLACFVGCPTAEGLRLRYAPPPLYRLEYAKEYYFQTVPFEKGVLKRILAWS